ncbi:MAG: LysE family translocator [Alphaproteobacteria bacterium]
MAALFTWPVLAPFLLAALALNLTPGADMAYVTTRSLGQGRTGGIAAAFGVALGCQIHGIVAALGLSIILRQSEIAFLIIKYVGATYLLYLAIKTLRQGVAALNTERRPPLSFRRVLLEGCLTNLLNPKVAIFILAFLPQFTNPARGDVGLQIFILSVLFNCSGTSVNILLALLTGSAGNFVTESRRFAEIMRWATASVFMALALRLALQQRH